MVDLNSLNPEQARAVRHGDGPILVLAGAGSGKTRVITFRIAHLIGRGVRPDNILGVTFTNKAAAEMRERVASLISSRTAREVTLGTFHALGARILREQITVLGYHANFTILDEGDRRRVLKEVLKELRLDTTGNEKRILWILSRAKSEMRAPAELDDLRYDASMPRAQRVYEQYERALRNLNAVDFDDLLLLPTRLFRENPDIREQYRHRYRYVLVDEYQDTNPIQLAMLQELIGPPHNLMAVGDDDQSIYGFRGAVADNILKFEETFRDPVIVTLEQNYRSVSTVLEAANAVIANNSSRRAKKLWSDLGTGPPIRFKTLVDDGGEADWISSTIAGRAQGENRPLHDFAVLYRGNSQARPLEESLRKHRVPYRMLGGQSFFDRKEVKDALAYMRLLVNPRDELSIRRIINFPTRGIGTTTLGKLDDKARANGRPFADVLREAARNGSVAGRAGQGLTDFFALVDRYRAALRGAGRDRIVPLLHEMMADIGMEAAIRGAEKNPRVAHFRWLAVTEMLDGLDISEGETAWAALDDYVRRVTLESSSAGPGEDDAAHKVTLTTIHSSKGLEFPIVFLIGMSDKVFPHARAIEEGGLSEERRLLYVGMTRAKRELFLTRSAFQMLRGERLRRRPSRFLQEIPEELIRSDDAPPPPEEEQARAQKNADNFAKLREMLKKS